MQAQICSHLGLPTISDLRNGVIWCEVVEAAYTAGSLAIGVDDQNDLRIVVLDREWLPWKVRDIAKKCKVWNVHSAAHFCNILWTATMRSNF